MTAEPADSAAEWVRTQGRSIAGGMDLAGAMTEGRAEPALLVDGKAWPGPREIAAGQGRSTPGAAAILLRGAGARGHNGCTILRAKVLVGRALAASGACEHGGRARLRVRSLADGRERVALRTLAATGGGGPRACARGACQQAACVKCWDPRRRGDYALAWTAGGASPEG